MTKQKVKAVLFDMDGVLVDSVNAWFHVFNDSLGQFRFKKLTKKEFKKGFGSPIEQDIKNHFIGKTVEEVAACFNMFFEKRKNLVRIFPDSKEVLESLKKRKIKLGLLSNSTRFIVLTILDNYKIRKYFDVIVAMEDVKRRKPSPDMVLKACRKLKVNSKNAIIIGDTMNDMIAGRRAGCVTVGYRLKGDYRIDRLKEIERFICSF
ncbi:MAG TPA: HAD family hydrolase [Candidatus Nanoarchaeia archaeon]|nr:HAD family hydrolase [Candidatus Nanoarchaeia archaeon]